MKNEKYYNDAYLNRPEYSKHYTKSIYYELWKYLMKYLNDYKDKKIYDFGCGTGQFAKMLDDNGFKKYIGLDFSGVAIEKATSLEYKNDFTFMHTSITNWKIPTDDFILALEVFEHIEDLELLNNQISGTHILFTVPDFNDPAHLRYFNTTNDVYDRYHDKIKIALIDKFEKYYIVKGEIR